MQVYRGMDIGTAKPTPAEREAVPHHLIDLVDAIDDFTVAEFQLAYREVLTELAVRGRRAILVGGTGLYHRVVVDDLELPGEWPDDPRSIGGRGGGGRAGAAARTAPSDRPRPRPPGSSRPTCAASCGRSRCARAAGDRSARFGPGLDAYPPSPVIQIGLRWDRAVLSGRIERARPPDDVGRPARRGPDRRRPRPLAHRRAGARVQGAARSSRRRRSRSSEAIEQIIVRTRQFAVRQLRWFGRDPRVRWVDIEHDPVAEAAPVVRRRTPLMTTSDPHQAPRTRQRLPRRLPPGRAVDDLPALARRLCDRRRGIGADGLLVGRVPPPDDDRTTQYGATMVLFNADGSRAEMSGNGIRCFAQALSMRHDGDLDTVADLHRCRRASGRRSTATDDPATILRVGRHGSGRPDRRAGRLGGARMSSRSTGGTPQPGQPAQRGRCRRRRRRRSGRCSAARSRRSTSRSSSPATRQHEIRMRVHERGAGITEACGTGACAAAVRGGRLGPRDARSTGNSSCTWTVEVPQWSSTHPRRAVSP